MIFKKTSLFLFILVPWIATDCNMASTDSNSLSSFQSSAWEKAQKALQQLQGSKTDKEGKKDSDDSRGDQTGDEKNQAYGSGQMFPDQSYSQYLMYGQYNSPQYPYMYGPRPTQSPYPPENFNPSQMSFGSPPPPPPSPPKSDGPDGKDREEESTGKDTKESGVQSLNENSGMPGRPPMVSPQGPCPFWQAPYQRMARPPRFQHGGHQGQPFGMNQGPRDSGVRFQLPKKNMKAGNPFQHTPRQRFHNRSPYGGGGPRPPFLTPHRHPRPSPPPSAQLQDDDHTEAKSGEDPGLNQNAGTEPQGKGNESTMQGVGNAAAAQQEWPRDLKNFVSRCFASVKDDDDKNAIEKYLKVKLTNAFNSGTAFKIDWDSEPVPPLASASAKRSTSTPEKTDRRGVWGSGRGKSPVRGRRWSPPGFRKKSKSRSRSPSIRRRSRSRSPRRSWSRRSRSPSPRRKRRYSR